VETMDTTQARVLVTAAAYADPVTWHAEVAKLRLHSPVWHVEPPKGTPFWAVLGQPEVMEVERNPAVFTNAPLPAYIPVRPSMDDPGDLLPVNTLIQMDGDEHRSRRALVNEWFKPKAIRELTEKIEAQARLVIDEMEALGESCDFAQDVAMSFPLRVILEILGLPQQDFPLMLRLTQELFGGEDPDFARIAGEEQSLAVIMEVVELFTGLNADRRRQPANDLATVIANGQIDGKPLEDMDTYGYYLIVATAGHDTTSSAIAGGMQALMENPDQLALLQGNPQLIDKAADEIVRWVSPVKHFMRSATEDYTLSTGDRIQRGDWLFLSYPSANRDDRVFADPFCFDVTRADVEHHLGFGFGRHFCLGAHLARLEIRAFFKELLGRLEHIEFAGDVETTAATLVSGPKRLPVTYRFR